MRVAASIVQARDQVQFTARRLETASFTVNIPIRCLAHASGRRCAGERRWLKVVFFHCGVVTSAMFTSRQEIESTQSIQSKLPRFPDECISLPFCVRRYPDRAPSRVVFFVHPPDAARSIVVIQKRSLTQFRSCVARRSGEIVAGSVPQKPFEHIAHCLCLKYRASPIAIPSFSTL